MTDNPENPPIKEIIGEVVEAASAEETILPADKFVLLLMNGHNQISAFSEVFGKDRHSTETSRAVAASKYAKSPEVIEAKKRLEGTSKEKVTNLVGDMVTIARSSFINPELALRNIEDEELSSKTEAELKEEVSALRLLVRMYKNKEQTGSKYLQHPFMSVKEFNYLSGVVKNLASVLEGTSTHNIQINVLALAGDGRYKHQSTVPTDAGEWRHDTETNKLIHLPSQDFGIRKESKRLLGGGVRCPAGAKTPGKDGSICIMDYYENGEETKDE